MQYTHKLTDKLNRNKLNSKHSYNYNFLTFKKSKADSSYKKNDSFVKLDSKV